MSNTIGSFGDVGHFVEIDGHTVFISDRSGIVPDRLKATANAKGRFSKAALQRKIIDHHNATTGGSYTAHDERVLNEAAGAGDPFTFHKSLPTEIKDFMAGRPELRSMFKVTQEAGRAGGADAFGALGDRYLSIAEAKAGSPLKAALHTAYASPDPEIRLLAHVHDNLPAKGERMAQEAIAAKGLRVGDQFKTSGQRFRVAEDEHGYRVLRSHEYGEDVPVEAVGHLPIDRGSFRPGPPRKVVRARESIPFSRAAGERRRSPILVLLDAPERQGSPVARLLVARDP